MPDRKAVTMPHASPTADKRAAGWTVWSHRIFISMEWRLVFLLVAMAAVTLFFGSLNHYYLAWAHFLDMGRQASLLVVVAIGANLIIVAGEIDLSVGAVVGLVRLRTAAFRSDTSNADSASPCAFDRGARRRSERRDYFKPDSAVVPHDAGHNGHRERRRTLYFRPTPCKSPMNFSARRSMIR